MDDNRVNVLFDVNVQPLVTQLNAVKLAMAELGEAAMVAGKFMRSVIECNVWAEEMAAIPGQVECVAWHGWLDSGAPCVGCGGQL